MKSVQIRKCFWSVFSCIRTKYEDLRSKSPYSVQIQENTDQKKLRIWTLFTQCEEWPEKVKTAPDQDDMLFVGLPEEQPKKVKKNHLKLPLMHS